MAKTGKENYYGLGWFIFSLYLNVFGHLKLKQILFDITFCGLQPTSSDACNGATNHKSLCQINKTSSVFKVPQVSLLLFFYHSRLTWLPLWKLLHHTYDSTLTPRALHRGWGEKSPGNLVRLCLRSGFIVGGQRHFKILVGVVKWNRGSALANAAHWWFLCHYPISFLFPKAL